MPRLGNIVITVIASSCDFSGSPVDLGLLIIWCIFLVVFVIIAWFWFSIKKPENGASQIFPSYCFEFALFWALVYDILLDAAVLILTLILVDRSYILAVVYGFLLHCGDNFGALPGIWTAIHVTSELQDLVILGIILLYLTPYELRKEDRIRITKVVRRANVCIMAVVVALFVPFVVITSIEGYRLYSSGTLANSFFDLPAAYYLLLLCAAVYGAVVLLLSVGIVGQGNTTVIQAHIFVELPSTNHSSTTEYQILAYLYHDLPLTTTALRRYRGLRMVSTQFAQYVHSPGNRL